MFLIWNVKVFFYSTYSMQIRNRENSLTTNAAFFVVVICFFFCFSILVCLSSESSPFELIVCHMMQDSKRMRSCEIYDFEYVPCLLSIIFCTIYKSRFDFRCSILKISWHNIFSRQTANRNCRIQHVFSGPVTIKCVIDIVLLKF